MRIGLISDTHIPQVETEIPTIVFEFFQDVDLILHAGDIYIPSVLDDLEQIAPVLAAAGDDDIEIGDTMADERVETSHLLTLEGHVLYLVHHQPFVLSRISRPNDGSSGTLDFRKGCNNRDFCIGSKGQKSDAVKSDNMDSRSGCKSRESGTVATPDIVVFGHAHFPMVSRSNGALYINPGSPTFVHYRRGLGSVGILDLDSDGADARIFDLRQVHAPEYTGGQGFGPD